MSANKPDTEAAWVDPNEVPELTDAFFKHADEFQGDRRVKRGRLKADVVCERMTIQLESDVLAQFKASGSSGNLE